MAYRHRNLTAPYFVQLRDFERRLIRSAVDEAGGDVNIAANMLGVSAQYLYARSKLLGGVFPDQPRIEPPGLAADAWRVTGRGRAPKAKKNGIDVAAALDLKAPDETDDA